jgi:hypothetical protein
MTLTWHRAEGLEPRSYLCGHCNHTVGPDKGWSTDQKHNSMGRTVADGYVYLCSFCGKPTYFTITGKQYPGAPFGNVVESLPSGVAALYDEARLCMTVNSFTAAVLTCRKLLMHIAVEKSAAPGQSFLHYVEYLAGKGYVPPEGIPANP